MRRLTAQLDASMTARDPLAQMEQVIRAYLAFFKANPGFVELLIQERAEFKDRPKPTYFVHHDANIDKWHTLLRQLIAAGRVRDIPLDTITNVVGDLMYGTMFTNYFAGRQTSLEEQAEAILEIVLTGTLTDAERTRRINRRLGVTQSA
jgi:hypothetical protein